MSDEAATVPAYRSALETLCLARWPIGRHRQICIVTSSDYEAVRMTMDGTGAWVRCDIFVPKELALSRLARPKEPR